MGIATPRFILLIVVSLLAILSVTARNLGAIKG